MRTKRTDLALRVTLIAVGLAGMVLFVVVASATERWQSWSRLLALLAPAGIALAGLVGGAELREPFEDRTRWGGRRRGEEGAINIDSDLVRSGPRIQGTAGEPTTSTFGIRHRNTVVALVLTAVATAFMAPVALDALDQPELTETGFVAILALAPALYYLVRSAIRLATSSRAIRLDDDGVTFGIALGYVPPLRLLRAELSAVVDARGSTDFLHFVVDPNTGYRVRTEHVADTGALLASIGTRWPELAIVTLEPGAVEPRSFQDLAPPTAEHAVAAVRQAPRTGDVPSADRIRSARRVLRRRTLLAGAIFLVTVIGMFAAGWWYLSQRAANDRLLSQGTVVTATVVDVDRSARGPDSMEVAFEHGGVDYVRTLHSGYFSGYPLEAEGREIDVYFDEANPGLVRLGDRRNIHELSWVALLGAGAVGLLGSLALARTLHDRLTLDTAQWSRGRIHGIPRTGRTPSSLVLESSSGATPQVLRGVFGLGKQTVAHAPAWLGVGRRTLVVLPDELEHLLLTSSLPKDMRPTAAATAQE